MLLSKRHFKKSQGAFAVSAILTFNYSNGQYMPIDPLKPWSHMTTQQANVRTMCVHCTYKPVHTDLVRITFGMKVFWTYGSVRTMYVHSRTYNVRTLYVHCTYSPIPKLN